MDLEALRIDRERPAPPRARWPWWVGGAVALAAAAGTVAAVSGGGGPRTVDLVRLERRAPGAGPSAGAEGVSANGYVVAARRAALSADTPGRIVAMNVTEGSVVEEGDVVARLYAEEYAAALARAEADVAVARAQAQRARAELAAAREGLEEQEANLEAARAQIASSEADLKLARAEVRRVRDLVEGGIASARELDSARAAIEGAEARLAEGRARLSARQRTRMATASRVDVAAAAVEVAEARAAAAEAARAQADATLAKTEVRAPFDGVVVLKDAEVGEVVSPNSGLGGSNARGAVATMVDFDSLEVQVDVPEASAST